MKRSGLGRIFRSTSVDQNCLDTWYCSLISNALPGLDGSIRALGGVVEFAQRGVTRFLALFHGSRTLGRHFVEPFKQRDRPIGSHLVEQSPQCSTPNVRLLMENLISIFRGLASLQTFPLLHYALSSHPSRRQHATHPT